MTPKGIYEDAPKWRKEAHSDLVAALNQAHRQASGHPSMRTLGMDCNCSASTISRALSGKALPGESVLKQLVSELGRRGGLERHEAEKIMSLYQQIIHGQDPGPAAGPIPAAGTLLVQDPSRGYLPLVMCDSCGAAVIDRQRHNAWHWSMTETVQSARFLDDLLNTPQGMISGTGRTTPATEPVGWKRVPPRSRPASPPRRRGTTDTSP